MVVGSEKNEQPLSKRLPQARVSQGFQAEDDWSSETLCHQREAQGDWRATLSASPGPVRCPGSTC